MYSRLLTVPVDFSKFRFLLGEDSILRCSHWFWLALNAIVDEDNTKTTVNADIGSQ